VEGPSLLIIAPDTQRSLVPPALPVDRAAKLMHIVSVDAHSAAASEATAHVSSDMPQRKPLRCRPVNIP